MSDFDFVVKNSLTVRENVVVNGSILSIGPIKTYISSNIAISTDQMVIDTTSKLQTRSAKYLMQITTDSEFQVSEILLVHDGATSNLTEYGILTTGALPIASFSTDINGNDVRLLASLNSGSGNVWFTRTSIESVPSEQ